MYWKVGTHRSISDFKSAELQVVAQYLGAINCQESTFWGGNLLWFRNRHVILPLTRCGGTWHSSLVNHFTFQELTTGADNLGQGTCEVQPKVFKDELYTAKPAQILHGLL